MAAGPWTKAKIVKSSQNVPLDSISQHSKSAFTVYQEPDLVQPNKTPQRKIMPAENTVLSTRKEAKWEIHCPLALFENPDPTKRSMYCKDKVYQGTTEFSFEELRGLRWKEKYKQQQELDLMEKRKMELQDMERKILEQQEFMERRMREQQEAEKRMRDQQEAMERKMVEFQRLMTGGSSVLVQGSTGVMVTRPSTDSLSDDVFPPSISRQASLDTTANLLAANPCGVSKNRSVNSTTTPSPHGSRHQVLSQPSPTMNTKEAMAAMQALWSKPVGDDDQDPQPLQESGPSTSVPFQIYTDTTDTAEVQKSSQFEIFCDENQPPAAPAPAPFAIFCDENAGVPKKLPSVRRQSRAEIANRDEDKENSPVGTDDEDRENVAPAGYRQPLSGARSKSGILTEAENVEFIPLDVQEKMLDEEEQQDQREFEVFKSPKSKIKSVNKPDIPKPFAGNQTIMLPNEDDFERLAKMSSTPYNGKPMYEFEQDENTCAVNILYKVSGNEENDMGPPQAPGADQTHMLGGQRLDTIVETSREYYKSSSSSSGGDTLHTKTMSDRSHWGNTGHSVHAAHSTTAMSHLHTTAGTRTPGEHLGVTSASGYLGDKSTNITKSGIKDNKRELLASPAVVPSFEKRMKLLDNNEVDEDVFDEPTGMFSDMMAELKSNIVKKDIENSMQASILEETRDHTNMGARDTDTHDALSGLKSSMGAPRLDLTGAVGLDSTAAPGLNFTNAAPSLDLTSAPRLDITGAPGLNVTGAPRLNLTNAAPRLDMTGAPSLDITGAPRLNLTNAAPRLDLTGAPRLDITAGAPSLDMTGAPCLDLTSADQDDGLSSRTANLSIDDTLDPFHPNTHTSLLASLKTPVSSLHGYVPALNKPMPNMRVRGSVALGQDVFYISECKGEGGYAKVYAATRQDNDMDCTITGIDAVLKVQKPANDWEFYICTQVQSRLSEEMRQAFMSVPRNYVFNDGGVFVSYHQKFGTLLDIINIVKTCNIGKMSIEPMAIYFTIELISMIESLHEAGIIHADLKPDNLLLQNVPALPAGVSSSEELFEDHQLSLQLIDFGRSIDMKLLPQGASFSKVVETEGIKCPEMMDGKYWREHIDYFGLAAVAYCLLFQTYIETVKIDGKWEVKGTYRRWWQVDLWRQFFSEMTNIKGVEKEHLPSLAKWKKIFQQTFFEKDMTKHLKSLINDVMKAKMS